MHRARTVCTHAAHSNGPNRRRTCAAIYVPRAYVTKDRMWEVFHSVPKMRAMAVDNASYEELQALYHGGDDYRLTLWSLVCEFNNGTIHPSVADVMGDLFLIGLEKRDDDGNVVGTLWWPRSTDPFFLFSLIEM